MQSKSLRTSGLGGKKNDDKTRLSHDDFNVQNVKVFNVKLHGMKNMAHLYIKAVIYISNNNVEIL